MIVFLNFFWYLKISLLTVEKSIYRGQNTDRQEMMTVPRDWLIVWLIDFCNTQRFYSYTVPSSFIGGWENPNIMLSGGDHWPSQLK
jgi:hypothetical protein